MMTTTTRAPAAAAASPGLLALPSEVLDLVRARLHVRDRVRLNMALGVRRACSTADAQLALACIAVGRSARVRQASARGCTRHPLGRILHCAPRGHDETVDALRRDCGLPQHAPAPAPAPGRGGRQAAAGPVSVSAIVRHDPPTAAELRELAQAVLDGLPAQEVVEWLCRHGSPAQFDALLGEAGLGRVHAVLRESQLTLFSAVLYGNAAMVQHLARDCTAHACGLPLPQNVDFAVHMLHLLKHRPTSLDIMMRCMPLTRSHVRRLRRCVFQDLLVNTWRAHAAAFEAAGEDSSGGSSDDEER